MRRDEDPDDRRAKTISLTDEGRSITATIEKELTGLRAEVLEGVSRGRSRSHLARAEPVQCGQARRDAEARRRAGPGAPRREAPGHRAMTLPSARDWLFSLKTFTASMLALYIALRLELPRPYWAMATVYIVSNPFVGATRSKALYRALGTMLGASAAVLFVPPFVESPYLFSFVVALWTGTLLYLAISDRTARSLRLHAGGLHAAADRAARRDESHRHLRSRHHAHRGDPARHRVRERRGRRGVSEPARAVARRAHRRLVSRRRVLRQGDAVRAHRGAGDFREPPAARRDRQPARIPAEPARLRPHAPRHPRARPRDARPDAVAAADRVGARRSADRAAGRRERSAGGAGGAARGRRQMVRRPARRTANRRCKRRGRARSRCPARTHRRARTADGGTRHLGRRAAVERALAAAAGDRRVAGLPRAAHADRARSGRLAAALPALAARRLGALLRPRHAAVLGGLGGGGDLRRVEYLDQLRLAGRRRGGVARGGRVLLLRRARRARAASVRVLRLDLRERGAGRGSTCS